jgi:glycosyltransferase involved in cell wall biosynthesis
MKISFIIPSRNNLKYLKHAVRSIEEYYNNTQDIILLDDASTDGTWEWIQSLTGDHFIKYRNEGPERVGHIPLYNLGAKLCKTEVFTAFHADMIITNNFVANTLKHLKRKTAVSSTRIEPPLHPPGPEKFVRMYGFEPEEFQKDTFLQEVEKLEASEKDKITNGMFVPWTMYKEDFLYIGGFDDELFAPMELDDSDLANRLYLWGCELIQSRDSFVYHMTCRGSRFKDGIEVEAEIPLPDGTIWYKPKDSEEYKALRALKFREWWRKWGQNVLHDDLMMPIVNPKYNIAYVVKNCKGHMVEALEPWCDRIYIENQDIVDIYIDREQPNTKFDLTKRVFTLNSNTPEWENDIVIEFDATQLTQQNFQLLTQMPSIIKDSGEVGEFEIDIFRIVINHLEEYQNNLIIV